MLKLLDKRIVLPGYTVITNNMSAASAISSVIAADGVSGEMATPAFMLRLWMFSMRGRGLSEQHEWIEWLRFHRYIPVASRWKQYMAPPASAISSTHCKKNVSEKRRDEAMQNDLLGLGHHHMAVHEYPGDSLMYTWKDGGTCAYWISVLPNISCKNQ